MLDLEIGSGMESGEKLLFIIMLQLWLLGMFIIGASFYCLAGEKAAHLYTRWQRVLWTMLIFGMPVVGSLVFLGVYLRAGRGVRVVL